MRVSRIWVDARIAQRVECCQDMVMRSELWGRWDSIRRPADSALPLGRENKCMWR